MADCTMACGILRRLLNMMLEHLSALAMQIVSASGRRANWAAAMTTALACLTSLLRDGFMLHRIRSVDEA
ncbi:hypothetical protein ATN79_27990 [Paraburkholderia caribensis]|nr:hypothetical protein ATN79_27990 [Paraburkholderia caribensis]